MDQGQKDMSTADLVAAELQRIGAEAEAFSDQSGIRCRRGCGECCLKPAIEATVLEMLPLAETLLDTFTADAVYDAAAAAPDGRCVLYRPDPLEPSLGRCSRYSLRPSVCRLFGFAAVSDRSGGAPQLASCHWHKALQPDAVRAAQAAIDHGAAVPRYSEATLRLGLLAPGQAGFQHIAINRAIMAAIEKLALGRPRPQVSECPAVESAP